MHFRVTPLRMLRLCLKELRESLRDRRTIVTLVLMPLLVYPLLSLVLNRVLLTTVISKSETLVTVGVGPGLKESQVGGVLNLGYILVQDREATPVFTEAVVGEQSSGAAAGQPSSALTRPQLLPLGDEPQAALRNGSVDIVITRNSEQDDVDEASARELRLNQTLGVELLAEQYASLDDLRDAFDSERVMELVGHFDISYRAGDSRSERALQIVERILAAVNNEASRELLGGNYEAPFRIVATPVVIKSNYADLLATMVPLVLVLMTMAGAVYPAIDLTAGERERGTMEALIVSPMPSYALLMAKYSAVVVVALLTALANLAAMTITLWVSGIGKMIFGDGILSTSVIGTVLVLLILFTMFFAALLLAVTSFAKSFKEAQAYLIPLMLLALTPGVMSLLPGIKFTGLLATVPLVNIVLLAREILLGDANWNTAMVAVICNGIYALAALAVASRLFGSGASAHGSQGSWRDLLSLPSEMKLYPSVDQMALTMAVMFPFYFIASSALPSTSNDLMTRLWISAAVSIVLIFGLPLMVCYLRRISVPTTFRLEFGAPKRWIAWTPAILLVGVSAWTAAHEIFLAAQSIGIGTITPENLERVSEFRESMQELPLWFVLFVFAVTPAVCEEFLFRGFVLSSLRKYSATWAVIASALLFGLMHVLTSNVLAVERFLPTTFMGLVLGFIALRTGSLWPGVFVHALHNGLLLSMSHYSDELKSLNFLVEEQEHLPVAWLAGAAIAAAAGCFLFWHSTRRLPDVSVPSVTAGAPDANVATPEMPG